MYIFISQPQIVNSLAPERCCCYLELLIFKLISVTDILGLYLVDRSAGLNELGIANVWKQVGGWYNIKMSYNSVGIPIIKIRRSLDSLIFIMGIPVLIRWCLYNESAHRSLTSWSDMLFNLISTDVLEFFLILSFSIPTPNRMWPFCMALLFTF